MPNVKVDDEMLVERSPKGTQHERTCSGDCQDHGCHDHDDCIDDDCIVDDCGPSKPTSSLSHGMTCTCRVCQAVYHPTDENNLFHIASWKVTGLDCPSCSAELERAVVELPEVDSAVLNYGAALLRVAWAEGVDVAVATSTVLDTVRKMGYDVVVEEQAKQSKRTLLTKHSISLWGSGIFTIAALVVDVAGLSDVGADALAIVGVVFGLIVLLPKALRSLRRKTVDMNVLMLIAVTGAIALGSFDEAAMVIFLDALGDWLEDASMRRNRESIRELMTLSPETARVRRGDEVVELPLSEVVVGDVAIIRPGDRIPLDGVVRRGAASVDEAPITGEPIPAYKDTGANLYAGSLSTDGMIEMEITALVADSTLMRIIHLVEEAQATRAPYETFVDRFAKYYTPAVVCIAILVAVIPTLISMFTPLYLGSFHTFAYYAICLLVISCPCALVISTPVSIVSAITRAARDGVLVKGGAFLELGARVDTVAFDKTGTLTRGKPAVTGVEVLEGFSRTDVLRMAAALEGASTHPLARAVVAAARSDGPEAMTTVLPEPTRVVEVAGQGIQGTVEGHACIVGKPEFARGFLSDASRPSVVEAPADAFSHALSLADASAATALCVVIDGDAAGVIMVADEVRAETPAIIAQLKRVGIENTVMLTGDNATTAATVAKAAGVSAYHAALLPQDKTTILNGLKHKGAAVVMVGDGINDTPALAAADIGIAMGAAGSDSALEVADVALLADDLTALPSFLALSKRTMRVIHQNVALALGFKVGIGGLAFVALSMGLPALALAVFADTGVAVIVILNGMRLLRPVGKRVHATVAIDAAAPGGSSSSDSKRIRDDTTAI